MSQMWIYTATRLLTSYPWLEQGVEQGCLFHLLRAAAPGDPCLCTEGIGQRSHIPTIPPISATRAMLLPVTDVLALSPGPLLRAEEAPHLPLSPGPGLPEDFSQQIQMFTRLQKRRRLFLAGTALRQEEPLGIFVLSLL